MRVHERKTLIGALVTFGIIGASLVVGVASPAQAATRSFLVSCGYSHSLKDDPIVVQDQPGASHLHDFFGNRGTNAYTRLETMRGVASTCPLGDRSAYWVPALYQNGKKINPAYISAYYENRAGNQHLVPYPQGFRMLLGNSASTSQSTTEGRWVWGCGDNTQIGGHTPPTTCESKSIQVRSQWPNCWNGKRGDGNDTANVRYSSGGKCPKGFDIALPTLRLNIGYWLSSADVGTITLSSAGGSVYSKHGDFINGWDEEKLQELVDRCLNADNYCGTQKGTTPGTTPDPTKPTTPPSQSATTAPTTSTSAPVTTTTTAPTTTAPTTTTPATTTTTTSAPPTSATSTRTRGGWVPPSGWTRPPTRSPRAIEAEAAGYASDVPGGAPGLAGIVTMLGVAGAAGSLVLGSRRRRRSRRGAHR